jgi:hypothetical protein
VDLRLRVAMGVHRQSDVGVDRGAFPIHDAGGSICGVPKPECLTLGGEAKSRRRSGLPEYGVKRHTNIGSTRVAEGVQLFETGATLSGDAR